MVLAKFFISIYLVIGEFLNIVLAPQNERQQYQKEGLFLSITTYL